jgi:hypothetical protein
MSEVETRLYSYEKPKQSVYASVQELIVILRVSSIFPIPNPNPHYPFAPNPQRGPHLPQSPIPKGDLSCLN